MSGDIDSPWFDPEDYRADVIAGKMNARNRSERAGKKERIVSFNHDDVIAVAESLIEEAVQYEYHGDYGPHESTYDCIYCGASSPDSIFEVRHEMKCPVLIARDLLTGND
ncbi:MAG: hypothetical protein AAF434_17125 [Pseudomonadota bacterium]